MTPRDPVDPKEVASVEDEPWRRRVTRLASLLAVRTAPARSALGRLVQWGIQTGVTVVGTRVPPDADWLNGPIGSAHIGADVYDEVARTMHFDRAAPRADAGLLSSFDLLGSDAFDPAAIDKEVRDFYEHTARYGMDIWSKWNGPLQVFPRLVIALVSTQIQQFNLPLSAFDNSRGMTSDIIELRRPGADTPTYVGWLRSSRHRGDIVYAGFYSTCTLPGPGTPHVRVVFPLPNGNSTAILRPEAQPDGSLLLVSDGKRFGDCGAYRVHRTKRGRVRAVFTPIKEQIHVYVDDRGTLRTDHTFALWSRTFLKLHYKVHRA